MFTIDLASVSLSSYFCILSSYDSNSLFVNYSLYSRLHLLSELLASFWSSETCELLSFAAGWQSLAYSASGFASLPSDLLVVGCFAGGRFGVDFAAAGEVSC